MGKKKRVYLIKTYIICDLFVFVPLKRFPVNVHLKFRGAFIKEMLKESE